MTDGYNGWSNWATWHYNLALSNDEGTYRMTQDWITEAIDKEREYNDDGDDIPLTDDEWETVTLHVAQCLEGYIDLMLEQTTITPFLMSHLTYSLREIDHQEIAQALVSDYRENVK